MYKRKEKKKICTQSGKVTKYMAIAPLVAKFSNLSLLIIIINSNCENNDPSQRRPVNIVFNLQQLFKYSFYWL